MTPTPGSSGTAPGPREERDDYRTTTEVFARAINALTVENDKLRKDLSKHRSSKVAPLPTSR